MGKPVKHVFVCTQSRPPGHPRGSCGASGSMEVMQEFMQQFEDQQLWGRIALTSCGCLGTCSGGPTVLVYPEAVLYNRVSRADVSAIIEEHLLSDRPVERLKAPAEAWS